MKFCDKCGNMLIVKTEDGERFLFCRGCNTKYPVDEKVVFTTDFDNEKKVIVFESEESTFPTTKVLCPKCGSEQEAEWTMIQTRAADEPPTRFYRCKKCKCVWREYS
jgi:DNA-directed RNA polymerase subunit M